MRLKNLLFFFIFSIGAVAHSLDKQETGPSSPPEEQLPPPESNAPSAQPFSSESNSETTESPPETPAPLPSSKEVTNSYESAFVRMLVTLLGLVLLIFVTFWVLRKLGKGKFKLGSGTMIQVLERRALSPKSILYILQIDNKRVLISESQLEVRTLTSLEELPETDE